VAIISTGVDILFISDPSSSGDAISKRHWEEWGKPLTSRLVNLVKPTGIKTIMHVCGDNLALFSETLHALKVSPFLVISLSKTAALNSGLNELGKKLR
jgi:uroporphyrinogen-III decarboxylase